MTALRLTTRYSPSLSADHATDLAAGVYDQQLNDAMRGVERQLLPRLVVGGEDLNDDRRCGHPAPRTKLAMDAKVGDAVVLR
jgi:hypothetical protein